MEDIDIKPTFEVDSVTIQNYEENNTKPGDEEATSNYNNININDVTEPSIENVNPQTQAVCVNENDEIECLPGYRFDPFDHELINHYLLRKVNKQRLPHNKMKEVELYKYNPEDITKTDQGLVEKEWYFFTPRDRKYKNGNRPNRAAGDGYWKATGADKPVYYKGKIVGQRKALVFYQGKAPKGDKTNWIMHEYRAETPNQRTRTHDDDMRLDDWVLCRIYKKNDKFKKAPRKNHNRHAENSPSEENSPVRVPIGQLPTSTAQLPSPVTNKICRNVMGSHSSFQRINSNPFHFKDTPLPNNFLFAHSLAFDNNPQPLTYGHDLPPFPNQQYDFENYEHEFGDISEDVLDDFPNFSQNYEYVLHNNFQSDSVVDTQAYSTIVFPSNAQTSTFVFPNNSQVGTHQSASNSPADHSST